MMKENDMDGYRYLEEGELMKEGDEWSFNKGYFGKVGEWFCGRKAKQPWGVRRKVIKKKRIG